MYEFAYILDGVLSEEKLKDAVRQMTEFIAQNECNVLAVDEVGMKRLSYPIRKKNNGYYVFTYFEGPGSFIGRLERAAQINDQVLRYLTLRYDAKMRRHFEKQQSTEVVEASSEEETDTEAQAEVEVAVEPKDAE
jgi:small subunit ribosomal protein S6